MVIEYHYYNGSIHADMNEEIGQTVDLSCNAGFHFLDHLIGQVVKTLALRAADPEFDSCFLHGDFSGLSHTSD